ncbi:MAG: hypothetical protein LBS38_00245 [Endomicrobium sp.]|jgi:hypothetical protein|nr:hypothetical protein [Endomicrobium sp.]
MILNETVKNDEVPTEVNTVNETPVKNSADGNVNQANKSIEDILNKTFNLGDNKNSGNKTAPENKVEQTAAPENAPQKKNFQNRFAALNYWNDDQKKYFAGLSDDDKEKVLDFSKENQKIYEKITESHKKQFTQMNQALQPVLEILDSKPEVADIGIGPKEYVKGLIDLNHEINNDPALHIAKLVDAYGLSQEDIDDAFGRIGTEISTRAKIAPVEREISELRNHLKEQMIENQLSQIYNQLSAQKDDNGCPKYKFLDKIPLDNFADMVTEFGIEDFDKAYDSFVWSTPEFREELLKEIKGSNNQSQSPQQNANRVLPTSIPNNSGMPIIGNNPANQNKTLDDIFNEAVAKTGFKF